MACIPFESPALYLRSSQLPVGVFIISNRHTYGVDVNRFLFEMVNGTTLLVYHNHIDVEDPFSSGAKATLLNRLSYVRAGDVWLLTPVRIPKPVIVTTVLVQHEKYHVIQQDSYEGTTFVGNPSVISFNIPMCWAKNGRFLGSDDEAFAKSPDGKRKKVTIALCLSLMEPINGHLESMKDQINAMTTNGCLAKAIAKEVEKTLDLEKNNVSAFTDGKFVKEVTLDNLFLVDLVQKSKATFQLTIALHV